MSASLSYALVTPVRDEDANLTRLAHSIKSQTVAPLRWIIVDTGSSDRSVNLAASLAQRLPFVQTLEIDECTQLAWHETSDRGRTRTEPTHGLSFADGRRYAMDAKGFVAGIEALESFPDVVIKIDADLSFDSHYFERLLAAFDADPRLGLASGTCNELKDGEWQPQYGTRSHVWGASRAYRWACLQQVLPLEPREGWDEIDAIKARVRGWRVRTLPDLPFFHHRPLGARDGSSRQRWIGQGNTAHYMGYRFSYLLARTAWRARRDPAVLVMIASYLKAVAKHEPRCSDADVLAYLRREQRLRRLPRRFRETRGWAA
jgi:biofilm PGA synthesis N-glycosyltransferase PgaC